MDSTGAGAMYILFSLLFFSFVSHLLSSPFFSFPLLVMTQIRGHIAGSFRSPRPAPHYGSCFEILGRQKTSALSFPHGLTSRQLFEIESGSKKWT